MNNELVKQLNDAGFPLKDIIENTIRIQIERNGEYSRDYRFPTLSELIGECGKTLDIDCSFKLYYHGGIIEWQAGFWKLDLEDDWKIVEEGSSPEEAVAKLWLIINKK